MIVILIVGGVFLFIGGVTYLIGFQPVGVAAGSLAACI